MLPVKFAAQTLPDASSVTPPGLLNAAPAGAKVVNNGAPFSVTEMLGLAKPVVTPLQSCLSFEVAHPGQACLP